MSARPGRRGPSRGYRQREMLYRCSKDQILAKIVAAADLVTADGAGVVLASKILGSPVPQRVAGFDLMTECLKEAAAVALPVYFLGAHPQSLQQAMANARSYYPNLNVVGGHHGYFAEDEEEKILEEIVRLRPSLLLVALGVPKQEKWIFKYKEKLPLRSYRCGEFCPGGKGPAGACMDAEPGWSGSTAF